MCLLSRSDHFLLLLSKFHGAFLTTGFIIKNAAHHWYMFLKNVSLKSPRKNMKQLPDSYYSPKSILWMMLHLASQTRGMWKGSAHVVLEMVSWQYWHNQKIWEQRDLRYFRDFGIFAFFFFFISPLAVPSFSHNPSLKRHNTPGDYCSVLICEVLTVGHKDPPHPLLLGWRGCWWGWQCNNHSSPNSDAVAALL